MHRPSESSTKPSTQLWPDCRDADSLGLGAGDRRCDLERASSIRPWCAAITAAGNSSGGIRRPSCVLRSIELAVYRSAFSQFPARHSRSPEYRARLPLPQRRSAPYGTPDLVEERRAHARPPLTRRAGHRTRTSGPRRAATRPAIVRARAPLPSSPLRCRVPRRSACGRTSASARQRSSASPDARGGADGEFAVLDAALGLRRSNASVGEAEWMVARSASSPSASGSASR